MPRSKLPSIGGRLRVRIARKYRTTSEEVAIGPLRFWFTRIANPDHVLDEVAAEADLLDRLHGNRAPGDQLHLPYWAELWDSGKAIGEYLVGKELGETSRGLVGWDAANRNSPSTDSPGAPTILRSLSRCDVLDLGCGMGMAGTVAAGLGARVVFADLEPPALLFARLNSLPWRPRVQTRKLNWQRDRLARRFDLILGADILYERAQWPFLESFWREHLSENGRILLGEPGRQTGDAFIDWIGSKGWKLHCTQIPMPTRPKPVRIFRVSRT